MEGIRLTISKYYLPSGKSISEVGVSPDIVVKEESEFKMDSDSDNQLNYAIKLFQSQNMTNKLPMRQGIGVIVLNEKMKFLLEKEKITYR